MLRAAPAGPLGRVLVNGGLSSLPTSTSRRHTQEPLLRAWRTRPTLATRFREPLRPSRPNRRKVIASKDVKLATYDFSDQAPP